VAKEELEKIFDRFYRSKSKSNASVVGSGIGLYYIKCLATKHKGFIKAEQNVDKGMTFKFCLPLDAVYDSSEMMNEHSDGWVDDKKMNITDQGSIDKSDEEENVGEKPQLLIVEDESNLQLFLENLLGPYYNIQKAFDGSEGLKKAFENIPDIIITDVMMPLMNGYEFCRNIKNDLRTCHIPVIMLTAKCNIEEQIEGINTGADVYISKPFHPDYLLSVLQGTIRNRRRIQHLIIDDTPPSGETEMTKNNLNKMDRELLLKLDEIMESGLSNSDLSIDDLASELNFSRSTFYRKIKTLIGISPNDYIRVYKVKRAAKLIESGDYSLSEVADMTGFSTQSYFSAMFKKHFDMTPSEYRNSKLSH
jgi:DNA-binding response OmpR family regulator